MDLASDLAGLIGFLAAAAFARRLSVALIAALIWACIVPALFASASDEDSYPLQVGWSLGEAVLVVLAAYPAIRRWRARLGG